MTRPPTFDHLKKPRTAKVWICNDDELVEEYEEAKESLDLARQQMNLHVSGAASKVDQLDIKVRDLEVRVREASVCWTFNSIGPKKDEALKDQYPPTQKQIDDHVKGGGEAKDVTWDPDMYPKALIYQSLIDPKIKDEVTFEEFCDWLDGPDWNQGEKLALFAGAAEANSRVRGVNLGNG